MRARLVLGGGIVAVGLIACGLGFEGIAVVGGGGGDGGGLPDASGDGAISACATLDTSCLGAPLPPGWQPIVMAGDQGCEPGYTPTSLVGNPRLLPDGCQCGACQVSGSYLCNGLVEISGGNNCGDDPFENAVAGTCKDGHAQHVKAQAPRGAGPVACTIPNDAGPGAAGDPVTICVPGCEARYCAAFQKCAIADGALECPSGFLRFGHAGTAVDPGCEACPTCDAGPAGPCTGTVTVFENAGCVDAGATSATYPVGTCNTFGPEYDSVMVKLTPPPPTCTATTPAPISGDAGLVGVKTICCR